MSEISNKTIYNLEVGDTFYYTNGCGRIFEMKIVSEHGENIKFYRKLLTFDNVFLTEEACQKSIDYDVALAKIKNRASELQGEWKPNLKTPYAVITNFNGVIMRELVVEEIGYILSFKDLEIAHIIIKELPNEVKTVLGVE